MGDRTLLMLLTEDRGERAQSKKVQDKLYLVVF